jgi:uncharacterized protein (TIGR03437 family)
MSESYSTTPIPNTSLVPNEVIGVNTNGGNYAAVLVTAASSGSITLQYITYNTSGTKIQGLATVTLGGPAGPQITQVQNNYSWIVPGAPNYGIAPGSIMTIIGSGMTDAASAVLQSSASPGIPTTLNNASVSITVNGTTVHPGIYYAVPTAIAVVVPSSTPVGTGTVTVTHGGTPSAPAPVVVAPAALGLDTLNGSGGGPGTIEDASTYAVFTSTNSARPGENIVLWGSGLGADTADSDTTYTATPHSVNTPLEIYIGGVQANILYHGASGYPGLTQIDVTVPSNVPTGCAVSVVGVSGTGSSALVSNFVSMPIATSGGTCIDSLAIVSPTQASTLSGKTTVKFGGVAVAQTTMPSGTSAAPTVTDEATAIFYSLSGSSLTGYTSSSEPSLGSCSVTQYNSLTVVDPYTFTYLNAGTVSVTGPPNGTVQLKEFETGIYVAGGGVTGSPAFTIPASGGTYAFTGTGGSDVGPFTAQVDFLSPLAWTNASSDGTVTRASGVTTTWTGGASGTYAVISGSSVSSSSVFSASFVCDAPVSAGTFTVPPAVLLSLPAGSGSLQVSNYTNPVSVNIPNLDFGFAEAYVSTQIDATYN